MEIIGNILDPIRSGLDPSVFDNPNSEKPKLKAVHRKWIIQTIHNTLDDAGYHNVDEWLSLVLTGSLTTYQYSDQSDVDISLFVDAEVFPEWSRAEMIGVMVSHVDGTKLPGTPHVMQCFVVAKGVSKEALYRKGLRSGYDLETDKWIIPPEKDRVHDVKAEENGWYVYALECADKMERLLKYEPDKAVQYWHMIHKARQRDQKAGKGDYSVSNIVYKFLANRGLMPIISDLSGEYIAKTAGIDDIAERVYQDTKETGGTTINLSGVQPTVGYAFSPFKNGETTIGESQFSVQSVIDFIANHNSELSLENNYIGSWEHAGLVYLDVTQVLHNREDAIKAAYASEQLAIFDLNTFTEIPILMNRTTSENISPRWLKQFGYLRNLKKQIDDLEQVPDPQAVFGKSAPSKDELHVALQIPDSIRKEIKSWVDKQNWPEGTELEDPSEYHVTLLYTHSGHKDHADADWTQGHPACDMKISGIDEFDSDDSKALVLRIDSKEAKALANKIQKMAEDHGLEVSKFPGGYKPHLTVAYGPGLPEGIKVPELEFKSLPSEVSPSRTSATLDQQAAKFVYDPERNHVLIGEMGNLEGEKMNHAQLMKELGIKPEHSWPGIIYGNGYGEHLYRGRRDLQGKNQYRLRYQLEKALSEATGVKWTKPQEKLNPNWDEDPPISIQFTGVPPELDSSQEPEPEWDFG